MSEIELKFMIGRDVAASLPKRVRKIGIACAPPRHRTLRSVYFDTPGGALRKAGISLRVRHDGDGWVQTVKAGRRINGGLAQADEFEAGLPDGQLSLAAIGDRKTRRRLERLIGDAPLQAVVETRIERTDVDVGLEDGTRANIAIDSGDIKAAGRGEPHSELEIELAAGAPEGLFAIARMLLPEGGLRFSHLSKSARGFLLAEHGFTEPPAAPRTALAVRFPGKQSAETAARAVLRECLAQIEANVQAVMQTQDPEGPHQLRIGLRRLRTALGLFQPALGCATLDRLANEARWLGREVGRLRDLDVVAGEILPAHMALHGGDAGFAQLEQSLRRRCETVRADLRRTLAGHRTQSLLLDLAEFIETGGWTRERAGEDNGQMDGPIGDYARRTLHKRFKKCTACASGIETLDPAQRHRLRKELKKLRYALEFFLPLLPGRRAKPFVKRLRVLQTVFGDLNDAAMLDMLLTQPPFAAIGDPAVQRAIGRLIGASQARAETSWIGARRLWDELADCKRPWA